MPESNQLLQTDRLRRLLNSNPLERQVFLLQLSLDCVGNQLVSLGSVDEEKDSLSNFMASN